MKRSLVAILLLLLPPAFDSAAHSQIGSNPPIPPSWRNGSGQGSAPNVHNNSQPTEDPADRMRREQIAKLNLKRQQQARADAARLLALATELKTQLEDAGNLTVPAKVAADTDEIAKLAKSIKGNSRPL